MSKDEALRLALEALESNRRTHHYCEDTWYSCPKHEDGCANDSEGDECNCGADEVNAEIEQAITAIEAALEAKDEPVVGTKTWFEDGKVVTQSLYYSDVYIIPPQQEAKDEPDYKALWQQMCERCDELDKKLAHQEHGWTPERIAGMARLKAQQDKRLEPQRTWIGLTNQELSDCWDTIPERAMRRVEAKLKEKNA